MNMKILQLLIITVLLGGGFVYAEQTELKSYPLNSSDNVITKSGVEFDKAVSSDGKGSLKINADKPTVINLFETGDIDIENAKLVYVANIKTENVTGNVYLEMWSQFEDLGEYFSRALHDPLTGNTDWKTQQTPFILKEGQNPDNVKLNLVIDGQGTVWIDDIKLFKSPLN